MTGPFPAPSAATFDVKRSVCDEHDELTRPMPPSTAARRPSLALTRSRPETLTEISAFPWQNRQVSLPPRMRLERRKGSGKETHAATARVSFPSLLPPSEYLQVERLDQKVFSEGRSHRPEARVFAQHRLERQ